MSQLEVFRKEVNDYVEQKLSKGPVGEILSEASIALTVVEPGLVWDIIVVVDDEVFSAFADRHGSAFVVDDHDHVPPIFTKVKSLSWLTKDLSNRRAIALWLYRYAMVLSDQRQMIEQAVASAWKSFQENLPALMRGKYLELRTERHNLRHITNPGDDIAFEIVKGNIAKLALELSLLVHGKPYPYKKQLPRAAREDSDAGRHLHKICNEFLKEENGPKTIVLSETLVSFVANMLRESGMFPDDLLERWWLHLQ